MEKPLPLRGGVMLNEEHLPHASIQEGGIQSFRSPHMSFNLLKKPVDCGHSPPVSVSRNCSSNSFWRSVRPVGLSTSICTTMSPKPRPFRTGIPASSEEHTSELQSLMRTTYAVFRLKKK